jgi:predicted metal-dependent hydrolase
MREFEKRPKAEKKTFETGEEFLYLGKKYKLEIVEGTKIKITEDLRLLFPKVFLWRAKARMHDWYKKQAQAKISERTKIIAGELNLKYSTLKISNAKTNWGSCGPKNSLNFNWRLIMAPEGVVDYVIVHELMHIPKSFGGGFIHHDVVHERNVEKMYQHYCNLKEKSYANESKLYRRVVIEKPKRNFWFG